MDIQVPQIIFQIINFSIILFVLKKFLYKPILKMLDDRAQRVKEGLEAAEKNIDLQKKLESDQQKVLVKAQSQADALIKEAQTQADQLLRQAKQEAKKEAKAALTKEQRSWQTQMDKQVKEFEIQANRLVVEATESILAGLFKPADHQKLIDQQVSKLNLKMFH